MLSGCASFKAEAPAVPSPARDLPMVPQKLVEAPPPPALDTQCRFPWYGVKGCKGKDTRAMLRLTVSDDIQIRNQLGQTAGWYEGVRASYANFKPKGL